MDYYKRTIEHTGDCWKLQTEYFQTRMADRNPSQRSIISVIGDEDTITGVLLAGVGHIDSKQRSNFLTVDNKTTQAQLEQAFAEYTTRKDIAILLINQHIANKIRHLLDEYRQAYPSILEMPSKDHPYDPSKDSVLKRVNALFGNE